MWSGAKNTRDVFENNFPCYRPYRLSGYPLFLGEDLRNRRTEFDRVAVEHRRLVGWGIRIHPDCSPAKKTHTEALEDTASECCAMNDGLSKLRISGISLVEVDRVPVSSQECSEECVSFRRAKDPEVVRGDMLKNGFVPSICPQCRRVNFYPF
jgi:hypothetical protein